MKSRGFLHLLKRHPSRNNTFVFVGIVIILNMYLLLNSDNKEYKYPDQNIGTVRGKKERKTFVARFQQKLRSSLLKLRSRKVLNEEQIAIISAEIRMRNAQQLILNLDKFGEVNETTPVLLIQVHSRLENLKSFITSLSYVYEIENSLLIFSHDVFLPEINQVIEQINFARVLQIFYPHSLQLNPDRFPGQGMNDCAKTLSAQRAKEIQCENWKNPDMYGNYREAFFTQVKHHVWWKINFVFGHITALENHTGLVAFLEEDYYAAPDLLWILNLMQSSMRENRCGGCSILEVGLRINDIFEIRSEDPSFYSNATVSNSYSTYGMAFNRTFWESMEKCTLEFCSYDDYNWDYSLKSVFRYCFPRPVITLQTEFPRVFHNGKCNGQHKVDAPEGCNIASNAINLRRTMDTLSEQKLLFPPTLGFSNETLQLDAAPTRNGGWGDIRDKKLCMSFSKMFANCTTI